MSGHLDIAPLLQLEAGNDLLERWGGALGVEAPDLELARASVLHHTRVHPGEALRATELMLASLGRSLDPVDHARLVLLRAHALRSVGDVGKAHRSYEQAFRRFERLGARSLMGSTAIGWVDALSLMGRPDEARRVARRGLRAIDPKDRLTRARLEANVGNVWWSVGRFDEAAKAYADARVRFRRAGDPGSAALCALNLGNARCREGKLAVARKLYLEAHESFRAAGLDSLTLRARYSLASVDLMEGRWDAGMAELDRLVGELKKIEDLRGAALVEREAAELLLAMGAAVPAEERAAGCLAGFRRLGLDHEAAHASFLHARLLGLRNRYHDAELRLRQATTHWKNTGNAWALRRGELETARTLLRRGDPEGALELSRSAQRLLDRRDRRGDGALCRAVAASAQLQLGRPGLGIRLGSVAYREARSYPASLERPSIALTVARSLALTGDGTAAVRWARRSVSELDRNLRRFGSRYLDGGVSQRKDEIYRSAIDIVLEHGGRRATRSALELIGKARSANLIEDLLAGREKPELEALRVAIARLRDELLSSEDPGSKDVRFRSLRRAAHRLEGRLEAPSRSRIGRVERRRIDRGFDEWSRGLGDRTVVVFDRGSAGWRAFVVPPSRRTRMVPLAEAERALMESWVPLRMLFEAIAHVPLEERPEFLEETREEADFHLEGLRRWLWDPLELTEGSFLIVPSGPLNGVPLEAAIELHEPDFERWISRLPHPALLRSRTRIGKPEDALVLHGPGPNFRREGLQVARRLARAGHRTVRSDLRSSIDAASEALGLLHVAAHGVFDRSSWIGSGFQLRDGWVGYEHLPRISGSGSLLYLGSCESGSVREIPGAELDGWMAAGLGSGARELLLTLWKVDDRSAESFAAAFYRTWTENRDAVKAARRARSELRRIGSHPFTWAPYVCVA